MMLHVLPTHAGTLFVLRARDGTTYSLACAPADAGHYLEQFVAALSFSEPFE